MSKTVPVESEGLNRDAKSRRVCVVGLGYVGLPLAVGSDQAGHDVHGYDSLLSTVDQLANDTDPMVEVGDQAVRESDIKFDTDQSLIEGAEVVVIRLVTPITEENDSYLDFVDTIGDEHLPTGAIRGMLATTIKEAGCVPRSPSSTLSNLRTIDA